MSEPQYAEKQLNFSKVALAGQGYRITQSYFRGGKITEIIFHFPPGCNGLVDMALSKDEQPFYPLTGYLSLNDATPVCYVDSAYYAKEPLTLEIRNRDGSNPHSVACTVTIRYQKAVWDET